MQSFGRRGFVTATLGAGIASALARPASAAALTEAEQANVALVKEFCASWATRDLTQILPRLADDVVYRMTETTPAVTGHAGIRERLGSWMQTSDRIEFAILDVYASGPIVVTRRIDRFISTTRPLTWEGVGVFFVANGKIKEWFDYTIRTVR
jgi:limonene-1,2-epoxide hydrolase